MQSLLFFFYLIFFPGPENMFGDHFSEKGTQEMRKHKMEQVFDDSTDIRPLLKRIEYILTDLEAPIIHEGTLEPGLDRDSIRKSIHQFFPEVSIPNALFQLYEWHNGSWGGLNIFRLQKENYILPHQAFLSMKASCEYLKYENEVIRKYAPDGENLLTGVGLFPIFAGPSYTCVGLKPENYGRIFFYSADDYMSSEVWCFDSIESMLKTYIEAFERGALYIDGDGMLSDGISEYPEAYKLFKIIARHNNPESQDYWTN